MKLAFLIFAVLLALYVIFIVLPGIVTAAVVFTPKKSFYTDISDLRGRHYDQCRDTLQKSSDFFRQKTGEHLTISGYDGTILHCDYYPNGASDEVAVLFHGYRSTPEINCGALARWLFTKGRNVALVYERGHNGLPGKRIGLGTVERHDILSWCTYFQTQTSNKSALVYGVSMGSTALALASDSLPREFVRGIVLDCGFVSTYNQMKLESQKRNLPAALLMPYIALTGRVMLHENIRESTCPHLSRCPIPKLFLHGTADSTVPYEDTQTAFAAAAEPKALVLTEQAEHTFSYLKNPEEIQEKMHTLFDIS